MHDWDESGLPRTRRFSAPADGGYVLEHGSELRQACYGLQDGGHTLTWQPDRDPSLATLIRRERQRCLRRERTYWAEDPTSR